jgi:hypothetical protein
MILYTMMPYEQVFPPAEDSSSQQIMINYNGIPVMAEWTENHEYRVVRVMSTDPNHYMNNSCMPGSIISVQQ